MFRKVLIANRGEVALRVARTCRELGVASVAVYSTADRGTAVTRFADESVHIGPPAAGRSYLSAPALLEAARRTGADAVHPGYGFLSEDPDFAEACAHEGITFIGPDWPVLARLGDKAAARELMAAAGLPVLPGGSQPCADEADCARTAADTGYPVIVKAIAGGGGRGMAIAHDPAEISVAFRETRATAELLYGDDRVFVERYLPRARHVEVQVLGDRFGAAVHLGDRDCSVQRRHQKLVEETPAPGLCEHTRAAMAEAAVRGVRAAGLVGAATVEFLVDAEQRFYFMEVNARLQVEHPVTEMTTGVDVVECQLRVAAGEPLPITQERVRPRGASVECRINAEDPEQDFRATPGALTEFHLPSGPFVRVDTHFAPGDQVPPFYDPLLAKVVTWGPTRARAIGRMVRALGEVRVAGPGIRHNVDLLTAVLSDPDFLAGTHSTHLLDELRDRLRTGVGAR
ncbi:biotin carboxylase N-terminal domain-containing protein [Actinokineospora sp. NBRC 105648]|uniref:acetyl-CoA carboxylase biotin carboxylase subunit n=1 Tax=Actinokineospora sp. NBRC 105648 TaxID=3032206 RepID=UPI0024A5C661|nr:biotin carboxylase N-terminal domain-containing protein [Actinokineospora sp. NBRC 105648]GLZ42019.1 acetyl-CoA carboxylase biotin carboxylase subunit [Actinokineospora sp. NBRC 105648]